MKKTAVRLCAVLLAFFLLLTGFPLLRTLAAGLSVRITAVEDGRVTLELSGLPAGRLVMAAYDDGGSRLAAAASAEITAETDRITVDLPHALAEDDVCKVFLLDRESCRPLVPAISPVRAEEEAPAPEPSNILIAYFSATRNTAGIAEKIRTAVGGDLFEILPAEPYTEEDLRYYTNCRADLEQADPAARPAIANGCTAEDLAGYDAVFLGYPIWHGKPPRIIQTFLESCSLAGKTVIPFCTSASSGYSDAGLQSSAGDGVTWVTGRRFSANAGRNEVQTWTDGLDLNFEKEEILVTNRLHVTFNGHAYTAVLAENPSVDAFVQLLKDNGGSVTVAAHDYGSFEKVGPLPRSIVQTNTQIDVGPGDLILYQGNSICLYYSTNSWNFTRLGRLEGDLSSLRDDLGSGDVEIVYSLEG